MLRFKMGTVSDLSLKSLDIQRPGGIMCDHLFIVNLGVLDLEFFLQNFGVLEIFD